MKFEELSKEHQELLMYSLLSYIEGKIRKGAMDEIIFPNYEEYKAFFDEFDGEYEIIDGLPESNAWSKLGDKASPRKGVRPLSQTKVNIQIRSHTGSLLV